MGSTVLALASGQVTPKDDYWLRQHIVVVDDATAEALAEARKAADKKDGGGDVLSAVKQRLPGILARVALGPAAMVVTELVIQLVIPALKKLKEQGIGVLPMSHADSKMFDFPVGHPVPAVLYVADPTNEKGYLPAGDFHRVVAQRKCAEAIRLLTSLGATSLSVHNIDSSSSKTEVGLGASDASSEAEARLGFRHAAASTHAVTFEARLGGHEPKPLPESLRWYADEPLWQAIALARRNNGMGRFTLEVEHSSDYGIDAGFFARIEEVDLKLGGSRDTATARRWRIEGDFGTRDTGTASDDAAEASD
jgi:hypothetical protein